MAEEYGRLKAQVARESAAPRSFPPSIYSKAAPPAPPKLPDISQIAACCSDLPGAESTPPLTPFGMLKEVGSGDSVASTADTVIAGVADGEREESISVPPLPASQPAPCAPTPGALRTRPRGLRVEKLGAGLLKITWPVDGKKLDAKEKQIISPSFEIFPGSSYKLMMRPTHIQDNFKRGGGVGSVELKLMDGVPVAPVLRFRIAIGERSPRELVEHDFSKNNIGGLASNGRHFDFKSAVDPDSSALLITLEVLDIPA